MYKQIADNKKRTWVLLVGFIVFLTLLAFVISYIFGYGYDFVVMIALFAVGWSLVSYYSGSRMVLASVRAQEIKKENNPYVFNMVENLCITSGLPVPKVYISSDRAMNAFATGRDPEHASICLTQGLIEGLENEELEGVIAHELSHIKNYDIRLMTLVGVLVGVIVMISDIFLRSFLWGRRGNRDRKQHPAILIIGIIFVILSPIIAQLVKMAISRRREFLADASAALLTRFPNGLASALRKISSDPREFSKASNATAHLYITNPFKKKRWLTKIFSTHPPIEERIQALEKMA